MKINRVKRKNGDYDYYLARSVRKKDKVTTVNVESLGKHSDLLKKYDDPFKALKEYAKEKTLEERLKAGEFEIKFKQESLTNNNQVSESTLKRIGHFYLSEIIDKLKLTDFFKKIKKDTKIEYNPYLVTKFLTIDRIMNPKSKLGTYNELNKYYDMPDFNLVHIYRTLDLIASNMDKFQAHLYKNSLNINSRNTKVLYYDCTNLYFESANETDLKRYGVGKDGKSKPLVGLGLFMDGNGIPLAFNIHSGNTNEQTTVIPLVKKIIKDFEISDFIYISDAGLNSNEIRLFTSFRNRDFIVTEPVKKLSDENKAIIFNDKPWYLLGDKDNKPYSMKEILELERKSKKEASKLTFYKDFYINKPENIGLVSKTINNRTTNKTDFIQRIIVTYKPKYKFYQEEIRLKQINKAYKLISEKKHLDTSYKSPKRFIDLEVKEGTVEINLEKIREEMKYDGYYALATSLFNDDVKDILKASGFRWNIEDNIKVFKHHLKSRPIYHRDDNRIKAHLALCFTSLLVLRIMEVKLERKYSTEEVLNQLRSMKVLPLNEAIFKASYTGSEMLDKLDKIFGKDLNKNVFTNLELNKNI